MDKRKIRKLSNVAEQIIHGYNNGMTLQELGDLHEVAPGTIRNLLDKNNIQRRPRGRRRNDANEQTG
jgi:hypothetical protein